MICSSAGTFEVANTFFYLGNTFKILILTIQHYRIFFCFSVRGAIAQVFGFSYLSCLWLYFHPLPLLPEVMPVTSSSSLCLWGHWCPAAASVAAVAGIVAGFTSMMGASTMSRVAEVVATDTIAGEEKCV